MRLGFIAIVMMLSQGCLTYKWDVDVDDPSRVPVNDPVFEVVSQPKKVKIYGTSQKRNHFKVTNNSDGPIFVVYKESFAQLNGSSLRVVSGDTRKINSDQASPDQPVAPGSSAEVSFYTSDSLTNQLLYGGGATFSIAIKAGGNTNYAKVKTFTKPQTEVKESITTEVSAKDRLLCYTTGIIYGGWCWFIKPQDSDREEAMEKAKSIYSNQNRKVLDIQYVGRQ